MRSALTARVRRCTSAIPALTLVSALAPGQSVVFGPRVDFGMAQENAQQSVCADFDHDGNLDIAATMEGNYQGKVEVLFGDGQSDFGSSTEFTSYGAWGLCGGDFNGDGWLDLAATSRGWAQHSVHIWLNDQNGGFTHSATVSTLASPPVGVAAGDFDGDGMLDLAAICESGGYAVDWFHGYGNGTFSSFHVVMNTTGLTGKRIYTGHFNGDAHLDLVAIHQMGAMVLLNDSLGTGNFNASSGIPTSEVMLSGAVADVDGDGKDDILTAGSNLKVWHGVGNGSFTLLHAYPTPVGPLQTTLGDLDNDGRIDVLLVGLGGVQIFLGQGGGAFRAPQNLAAGVYPKSGVIGDWNGDGWNDLAITCQNYAGLSSYLSVYDQVPPSIAANFTGSPTAGFAPLHVQFTDTSTGPVTGWSWDFDGDSVPDSTAQNPTWTYTTPGTYTVSLTVSNALFANTRVQTDLITAFASGATVPAAEILQYQFNEVRGQVAANTAATAAAPADGSLATAGWQSDPGRPAFRGNEPGFGCLGYRATGPGWVDTGWTTSVTGSFSVAFWLKRDPASTGTNPSGGVFGDGTIQAFTAGAAGQGITFRGSAIGNVDSAFPVTGTPGVWQHLTLVVDDAAGRALWYDHGAPSSNVVTFAPNTFAYAGTAALAVGATSPTGASPIGAHFHLDDFRFYSRALTSADVQLLALLAEQASAGSFGSSCDGPFGTPEITTSGGSPTLGNAAFAVNLGNAEDQRLAAIVFGFAPATHGTVSLAPWLGAGCELQTEVVGLDFHITAGNAAVHGFALPNNQAFSGFHVYGQWLVLGTTGAATRLLDINLR